MNKWYNNIKKLYLKYQELTNYLIVGVLTTIVSLGVKYGLLFTILDASNAFELQIAVIISWILAVLFAYIANRKFVFKSKNENIFKEMGMFVSSRIATLLMESLILAFFISYLKMNSKEYVILWTLITQVLITIGNYVLSKLFVFQEKHDQK